MSPVTDPNGVLCFNLNPINMSRCNVTRQWLVTETTRATLLLEQILEKSKDFEGEQFQSYLNSIRQSLTALRMVRYFSIPYDPEKPCSKSNCCRTQKAYHWYADEPEFPQGQE